MFRTFIPLLVGSNSANSANIPLFGGGFFSALHQKMAGGGKSVAMSNAEAISNQPIVGRRWYATHTSAVLRARLEAALLPSRAMRSDRNTPRRKLATWVCEHDA